ncbi:MAG: aminopeptidase, partial [Clostridia bacterium]
EVYKVGGCPFVTIKDNRVERALQKNMTREVAERQAEVDCFKMEKMQAYIGIRGGENAYETSDVPSKNSNAYNTYYSLPVHHERRVKNTKWVVLRYPTQGMSAMSAMSTEGFEDFYFKVCNLDYRKMDEAMTPLVELMNATDKVRIVAPNTDLSFSIKNIPAIKCSGRRNIPDGEVYTAPIRDSVNGVISYNVASSKNGIKFEDISLMFKDGKIVKATANDTDAINEVFDIDEGARYVGEFAIGVNPFVNKAMGDILFDEKINGSIHFTPGSCYDEASNGNNSAIHWDLVLVQTPQHGGGEIYFDDVLIRKDGRFVIKSLECLNPENLSK